MSADQLTAIRNKAELMGGKSLGEQGDLLVEMAAQRACSICQREDIPEAMEQAVAALVLTMAEGGEQVKSLTRGDTSITYDVSDVSAAALLAPFRRLASLKEESA